jgi:hypothetical protein
MISQQPRTIFARRIAAAVIIGFSATLACVAATAEQGEGKSPEVHPLTAGPGSPTADPAEGDLLAGGESPDAGDGGDAGCPHGALEDPHRGFVRCLAKGEKSPIITADPDAGDGGGADASASDSGGPDADAGDSGQDAAPPPPQPAAKGPVPVVEMKTPKFENGDVPKAEKALSGAKVLDAIAKCVSDAGGLTGKTGSLKVELLVRAQGKAEGVEVTPTGVPQEGAKCVRALFKNRNVGTPSADPVGVTVVYQLKPSGK